MATKEIKTPKTPVPFSQKVQEQLTKAVLTKKVSKQELEEINQHLQKLLSLV